ncbi:hypothetical protein F5883DRAFT_186352 [Diaporthe sp. PMI_573]|nr:hypothetical protein F5883DRAFT_186352 [Diaporthaceae sp. PMI_573]
MAGPKGALSLPISRSEWTYWRPVIRLACAISWQAIGCSKGGSGVATFFSPILSHAVAASQPGQPPLPLDFLQCCCCNFLAPAARGQPRFCLARLCRCRRISSHRRKVDKEMTLTVLSASRTGTCLPFGLLPASSHPRTRTRTPHSTRAGAGASINLLDQTAHGQKPPG